MLQSTPIRAPRSQLNSRVTRVANPPLQDTPRARPTHRNRRAVPNTGPSGRPPGLAVARPSHRTRRSAGAPPWKRCPLPRRRQPVPVLHWPLAALQVSRRAQCRTGPWPKDDTPRLVPTARLSGLRRGAAEQAGPTGGRLRLACRREISISPPLLISTAISSREDFLPGGFPEETVKQRGRSDLSDAKRRPLTSESHRESGKVGSPRGGSL